MELVLTHFQYFYCTIVFTPRLTFFSFFCMFAANKEYYHQWSVEECHGCSLDLSAFTIEELDNITSEYTLKNTVSSHSYSAVSQSSNEGRPDTVQ